MPIRKPGPRTVAESYAQDLTPAEARWENEGGADETIERRDRRWGAFRMDPVPPFRLDLSVWALRRRPGNAVDRWDGTSYRRALALTDGPVELSITQAGDSKAACLAVTVAGRRIGGGVENDVKANIERMLGLRVDLSAFYRLAAADSLIGPLVVRFEGREAAVLSNGIRGAD